jgi:hypothetical protein
MTPLSRIVAPLESISVTFGEIPPSADHRRVSCEVTWISPHERKNCFKAAPIGLYRLSPLVYLTISPNLPI